MLTRSGTSLGFKSIVLVPRSGLEHRFALGTTFSIGLNACFFTVPIDDELKFNENAKPNRKEKRIQMERGHSQFPNRTRLIGVNDTLQPRLDTPKVSAQDPSILDEQKKQKCAQELTRFWLGQ